MQQPSYFYGPDDADQQEAQLMELQRLLAGTPRIRPPTGRPTTLGGGIADLGQGIAANITRRRREKYQGGIDQIEMQRRIAEALMAGGQG